MSAVTNEPASANCLRVMCPFPGGSFHPTLVDCGRSAMGGTMNRRDFMATTAAAGLAAAARPLEGRGPEMMVQSGVKPVVVASANGHRFKNGGTKTCVETAFEKMTAGEDVLDALIAGVNIVELDPLDDSVG